MAKRSADDLDAIIQTKMPGYHLARTSASAEAGSSDASSARRRNRRMTPASGTPPISDLRSKFLGNDSADAESDLLADEGEEAEIVTIEPDVGDDEPRHAKSVVISEQGEILGAQG